MIKPRVTLEYFRRTATKKFRFLEEKGFRRAMHMEDSSPTGGTLVYRRAYLMFIFSFDVRDNCVDAYIVRIEDVKISKNEMYSYAQNLVSYLISNAEYRGGVYSEGAPKDSDIDRMLDEWASLIVAFQDYLLT